ncbi:MAG TPA: hypothetical protein VI893_08785 [Thermoplasmata archaeon]|nr:hypothetical protein [Thermoplasmata archaeon]
MYLLLLTILLVVVALRFPTTPHPLGGDTYLILQMAEILSQDGAGSWQLSPISYFGFYPYSYPTGYPAVVSAMGQMTGLTAEIVVYITALVVGLLSSLGAFVLCHRYTDDPKASLLAALIYGTIPVVIAFSNWQISARGPFLAILPFFLLALVARVGLLKKLLLIGLLLFAAMSVHRMAVMLVPVLLIYVSLRARPRLGALALRLMGFERRRWLVTAVALSAVVFGFAIPFLPDPPAPFDNHWWLDTEAGGALPDNVPGGGPSLLVVYVAGRWGISLLFGVLGLLAGALKEHKTPLDWLMLGMVVILAPFLPVASYSYETLTVVATLLTAVFLVRALSSRNSRLRLRVVVTSILIAGMIAFSSFTVFYRTGNYDPITNFRNYVTDDEYSSSLYLLHEANTMHVFNDPNAERKMTVLGRLPSEFDHVDTSTPVGFSWSDFWPRFQESPLLALRDPFTGPDELALVRDRLRLLQFSPDDPGAKTIMSKYDIEYLTVKRWGIGQYQTLCREAAKARYQIYASGDYAVYAL